MACKYGSAQAIREVEAVALNGAAHLEGIVIHKQHAMQPLEEPAEGLDRVPLFAACLPVRSWRRLRVPVPSSESADLRHQSTVFEARPCFDGAYRPALRRNGGAQIRSADCKQAPESSKDQGRQH